MQTRLLMIILVLSASARSAMAQYAGAMPGPSCQAPQSGPGGNCNCPSPNCNPCRPLCGPPCGPPREATPPNPVPREATPPPPPQETGVFVAPPRTGTSRGATNYRGLDFGTITFPEIRLRMPCIELPHCFCGKSGAQMRLDSGVAPWESHGFVNTAPAAAGNRAATPPENLPSPLETQSRAATERAACEEYSRKLQQYEDQLRRINEERKALEDCIRQCLETHRGAGDNIPSAEMGCVGQPGANGRSADAMPYNQPLTPPRPQPDNARRSPLPGQFREQPANFVVGPPQPIVPAASLNDPRSGTIPTQPIQNARPAQSRPVEAPDQEPALPPRGGQSNRILLEWLKTAPQTAYHSPCQ